MVDRVTKGVLGRRVVPCLVVRGVALIGVGFCVTLKIVVLVQGASVSAGTTDSVFRGGAVGNGNSGSSIGETDGDAVGIGSGSVFHIQKSKPRTTRAKTPTTAAMIQRRSIWASFEIGLTGGALIGLFQVWREKHGRFHSRSSSESPPHRSKLMVGIGHDRRAALTATSTASSSLSLPQRSSLPRETAISSSLFLFSRFSLFS